MSTGKSALGLRANRGGEDVGNRRKMELMTQRLVETGEGRMTRERARQIARDCALRQDGDLPGGSQRRR